MPDPERFLRHPLATPDPPREAGAYRGRLLSTYRDSSGNPVERVVTFRITQTWTRMSVEMTVVTGSSSSVSTSALGAVTHDGSAACLSYIYKNKVNPAITDPDMGDHEGAADLRIYTDGHVSGRYYNSRPRAGTIEAARTT